MVALVCLQGLFFLLLLKRCQENKISVTQTTALLQDKELQKAQLNTLKFGYLHDPSIDNFFLKQNLKP